MTTCLGKECSFGLLWVSFMKVYHFCRKGLSFLSLVVLRVGCGK